MTTNARTSKWLSMGIMTALLLGTSIVFAGPRERAAFPNFETDYEWAQTIEKSYAIKIFTNDPEKVGRLNKDFDQVAQHHKELFEQYKPLAKKGDTQMQVALTQAAKMIKRFAETRQEFVNNAVKDLPQHLKEAIGIAEKGKAQNKPLFFKGLQQPLGEASAKIAVFRVLAGEQHETTVALEKSYAEAKAKIDAMEATLKEQILADQQTPPMAIGEPIRKNCTR